MTCDSYSFSPSSCTCILFTRVPVAGKVKSRLSLVLSPEECAYLQEAIALDVAGVLSASGNDVLVCYSDDWKGVPKGEALLSRFLDRLKEAAGQSRSFDALPQRGDSIGLRMSNAINEAFARGASRCVLVGSDLPYLKSEDVWEAVRMLEKVDVVLGPSSDGGYWLVGMKEPFPELFEDKPFGTNCALQASLDACGEHGRSVSMGRMSSDVDTPEDYAALRHSVLAGCRHVGSFSSKAVMDLGKEGNASRSV